MLFPTQNIQLKLVDYDDVRHNGKQNILYEYRDQLPLDDPYEL